MGPEQTIFKQGSRTYYSAARFLPSVLRQDVFRLYSFVRLADDYVDTQPPNREDFAELVNLWHTMRDKPMIDLAPAETDSLNLRVTKNICRLCIVHQFEREWVDAFLQSMQWDLADRSYKTLEESLEYVYGSAEVIGLMMAKILGVPKQGLSAAAAQGRAMQWINFIRDIAEDNQLGRQYFPSKDLKEFKLRGLTEATALAKTGSFTAFIELQLGRYAAWQREAEAGMRYIPRKPRVAVSTAADGYNWTARAISKDPLIVFKRKVKPSRTRLLFSALGHSFD